MLNDELLVTNFAGTLLRMELDRVPLWRGEHVSIEQLVDDFSRYSYLPRLREPAVLLEAVRSGLSLLTWEQDSFGYAESYDAVAGRYRALQTMQNISLSGNVQGLIVRPDVARQQIDAESTPLPIPEVKPEKPHDEDGGTPKTIDDVPPKEVPKPPRAKRYHGSVRLDPTRLGRDAGMIADEVIAHLSALLGADVKLTLEIEAEIPDGAPANVVRTVTENSRTLKFENSGFEEE